VHASASVNVIVKSALYRIRKGGKYQKNFEYSPFFHKNIFFRRVVRGWILHAHGLDSQNFTEQPHLIQAMDLFTIDHNMVILTKLALLLLEFPNGCTQWDFAIDANCLTQIVFQSRWIIEYSLFVTKIARVCKLRYGVVHVIISRQQIVYVDRESRKIYSEIR